MKFGHNTDTSLKAFAYFIGKSLAGINTNGNTELERLCDQNGDGTYKRVTISTNTLKEDLETLIKRLNHPEDGEELLPQVVIARSNSILPTPFGTTSNKFKQRQSVKFVNKEDPQDTITFAGQRFQYKAEGQIIILTKTGMASREIGLRILNAIGSKQATKYSIVMKDDADKNYLLKDFGSIRVANPFTLQFSEATGSVAGVVANAADVEFIEEYFQFKKNDEVFSKYKLVQTGG